MAFNPEFDEQLGGNLPPRVSLFWKALHVYTGHLTTVRQSDVPRLSLLERFDVTPTPQPTSLLMADTITVQGVNGLRGNTDQIDGSLEFEINLTKDGSPYNPLLERTTVDSCHEPVILVSPELPPCYTDSWSVQEYTTGNSDTFPRVDLTDDDCVEFVRILCQLPVVTDPNQYKL